MEKGLKTGKTLIIPKTDRIRDPEVKRVIDEILRIIQDTNYTNYSDHAYLDERITDLEEA